jgi:hypothetical protein
LTSGTVRSAYLVDNEGEDLVKYVHRSLSSLVLGTFLFTHIKYNNSVTAVPTPGKPMQISFDLEYDGVGVGLALFTNDTRTNVSYTAVGTPSTTTSTAAITPTAPAASGSLIGIEPSWLSLLILVFLVAHVA